MKIETFTVGNFAVNTYLVTDEETGLSAVIDTGETNELPSILSARRPELQVALILLTHAHIDHAGALQELQRHFDVPTYMPRLEKPLFDTLPVQGTMFGMPHLNRPCGRIDVEVEDGDVVNLGRTPLSFISTPGHTPGQGCWYNDTDIIVGDTLFAGSIGRTDFPMSCPRTMVSSLRRLFELPHHLRVHSGHGPVTTLAHEFQTNPFLGFLRKERGLPVGPHIPWAEGM